MYSDKEKTELMEELKEMESLKVDTGSEGELLQKDLIDFIENDNGDKNDLEFRIEYFAYAFKLFCRKEVKFVNNQFILYLNDGKGKDIFEVLLLILSSVYGKLFCAKDINRKII